jgi:hypothetical protein
MLRTAWKVRRKKKEINKNSLLILIINVLRIKETAVFFFIEEYGVYIQVINKWHIYC